MPVDPQEYTYLWKDRIVSHPEMLGGKPIIKDTRLSVEFVTDTLCGGNITQEWFLEEYSHVTREDVQACLEYAATGAKLSNFTWAELDRWMDEQEEQEKRQWLVEWKERQELTYRWKERIVSNPEILGGKPIIKGTRLSVEFVTNIMRGVDVTEEWFLAEYTQVTREDLYACLEYAATGAKLSNISWAEYNRRMDEEEAWRKKEWLAEWKKKNAPDG